jgi:formylmethanofuran dehydrogenase subunit B
VVVDVTETETARRADQFLQIPAGGDFEMLWALRALVQGKPVDLTGMPSGLPELTERMKAARFGIVFFGLGPTRGGLGHRTVEALLSLTMELNRFHRWYARRMRVAGDVAGADSVLLWQTGYPFSVDLSRGYPRYNPGEFSGPDLIRRGEVDACLLVGSHGLRRFDAATLAALGRIPLIVLDPPNQQCPVPAMVRITTGVPGIHHEGTAYRMDEVPIPLRPVLANIWPTDAEVLERLRTNPTI